MAANVEPIFTLVPRINYAQLAAANTGADLSTNAALIFTGGTNGSLLVDARVKYLPGTSTVATACRLWINNGSALGTTSNNSLLTEITVNAITTTQVAGTVDNGFILPRNGLFVPNGYRVYVTVGTWSTGTFMCTGIGGDY
jgi:hypothetical protein